MAGSRRTFLDDRKLGWIVRLCIAAVAVVLLFICVSLMLVFVIGSAHIRILLLWGKPKIDLLIRYRMVGVELFMEEGAGAGEPNIRVG